MNADTPAVAVSDLIDRTALRAAVEALDNGFSTRPYILAAIDAAPPARRAEDGLDAVAFIESLRPPRNSLGKFCLPKSLMEYAVSDAWEGATSWVGDPVDGIEQHDLTALADGIVTALAARLSASDGATIPTHEPHTHPQQDDGWEHK